MLYPSNSFSTGEPEEVVLSEVKRILEGRNLVGHSVHNDLEVLSIDHPKESTRDTAELVLFYFLRFKVLIFSQYVLLTCVLQLFQVAGQGVQLLERTSEEIFKSKHSEWRAQFGK
jgi:hypothetical protein